ncbi:P-loop containing nucleoside triphosphate hydrolase protein [Catenaria anguillulae PL171]|uniref:p-loop containing nucleoside triphosphate hydrolase protein n=1 Tax=Catenaria anguillulae PL171 TaxID=765915 RepID=A0A1Y2HNM8_9FUNG|nr:P-loop containing nucleoside triphosphate hydrolase protein [Catenaria anguillulae PL171]
MNAFPQLPGTSPSPSPHSHLLAADPLGSRPSSPSPRTEANVNGNRTLAVGGLVASTTFPPHIPPKVLGEPIVLIKHLSKQYKTAGSDGELTKALQDIHLDHDSEFMPIRRGEFVILRGPSGGGKTTLLNILGTIDSATSGTVEILGETITSHATDAYLSYLRLRRIGFVFQTFNLLATMSAFENVELPMTILGKLNKQQRKQRALELLTMVGLQDRISHLPSELSGGEQQRVTIARALANEPDILLLDEPTGDLDTKNTVEVMNLLLRLNLEKRTTCIMVTHNPDVECYADRLLYLQDGKFARQVLNEVQMPLVLEDYQAYLKLRDQQGTTGASGGHEDLQEQLLEEKAKERGGMAPVGGVLT